MGSAFSVMVGISNAFDRYYESPYGTERSSYEQTCHDGLRHP
jgi:hypothetical protein